MGELRRFASVLRARLALLALMVVLAACGGICGTQASSAAPIEGYWSWEGNGVQHIKSVGSGNFEGTMVKVSTISACAAPVGRLVLKLQGSGNHYTGQDEWFRDSDCARRFSNDAVVDLKNGNNAAHLCSTGPFPEATPVSNCVDLIRVAGVTTA